MIDEQKVIGLLQAKALGCLDAEENQDFQEFIDAGHLFPWDEFGKFQHVASLLPLALQLELPDPALKDRVALKLIKLSEQLRASKIIEEDKFEIEEDIDESVNEFTNIDEPIVEPPIEIETEEPTVVEDNLISELNPDEITFNLDEVALPDFVPTEVSENNIEESKQIESPFDNLVDKSQLEYPLVEEVEISPVLTEPEIPQPLITEQIVEEDIAESKPDVEETKEIEDESKHIDFNKRSVAEKMFKAIEQDFDTLKFHFEKTERKTTRGLLISYIVIAVLLALLIFSFFKFSSDINELKNEVRDLKSKVSASFYYEQKINTNQYFSS